MTILDPLTHSGPLPATVSRDHAMLLHDMRGALQGVLGGVTLLEEATLPPEARAQADRIAAAARTLVCLVQGLFGHDPEPEARAAHSRIEVDQLLRHVGRRWTGEAQAVGGRFRVDTGPDLPAALRADLVPLVRALGNLIGNALRYGGDGEVRLAARRTPEGGLAFVVSDAGPGLPQATIDAATGDGPPPVAAAPDGHGLGLHIVRGLCGDMGGAFALANRPGGGLEARLSFPPDLCEDAPTRGRSAAAGARIDLGGLRVLLAEDNPTNQMVATQMLRALNAEVTLAADGVEALERFEGGEFDMIVVDIEMPRMTGLDVIRAVRARGDRRAAVPIVALTAYAMREHRDRIAAAGANGLISKPITSVEALGQALLAHAAPVAAAAPSPAAPTAEADDTPVVDLAVYDALCAAIGPGMMAELLDKVVADLLQARADLAAALSPIDRLPIRSASHILISVAGAVGATRLQSCARALNVAAHGADEARLPDDVRRCLVEIDAAVAFARSRRPAG
jgi:CheY-like chemotaxis protein